MIDLQDKKNMGHSLGFVLPMAIGAWLLFDQPDNMNSHTKWERLGVAIHTYSPKTYYVLVTWVFSHAVVHGFAIFPKADDAGVFHMLKAVSDAVLAPLFMLLVCIAVEIESIHVLILVPAMAFVQTSMLHKFLRQYDGDSSAYAKSFSATLSIAFLALTWVAPAMEFFQGYDTYGFNVRGVMFLAFAISFFESAALLALTGMANITGTLADTNFRFAFRLASVVAFSVMMRLSFHH